MEKKIIAMLKSYLTAAFRSILKNRYYFLVNVSGLSLGLAACLLILQYTTFHSSFDSNEATQSVYRVWYERVSENGDKVQFASACPPIGPRLKQNFPEVETFARLFKYDCVVANKDINFKEERVYFAESPILTMMPLQMVVGDTTGALSLPGMGMISEATALRYFSTTDVVGKSLKINGRKDFTIAGVFKSFPDNVHLKADILLSWESFEYIKRPGFNDAWFNSGFYTYIKLKEGVSPAELEAKIPEMVNKEIGAFLKENKAGMSFGLQPVSEIHLNSHLMQEVETNGDAGVVAFLKIIGWFILVIAWVNYFNISTISSLKRVKEIGIRKVLGSGKRGLAAQLALEGAIVGLASILVGAMITELVQGQYAAFSGLPKSSSIWSHSWAYLILLAFATIVTFSGGIYTALQLLKRPLLSTLRGEAASGVKSTGTKKVLVLFQFAIAIAMIAGTTIVYKQLDNIQSQDLRFDPSNIVALPFPTVGDSTLPGRVESFRQELSRNAFVEAVTQASAIPGKPNIFNRGGIYRVGGDPSNTKNYRLTITDSAYADVFKVHMIAGEWLLKGSNDTLVAVVNLNAMHELGFDSPEKAMGQEIFINGEFRYKIVGIVDDFYQLSPKEPIEPQIFSKDIPLPLSMRGYLSVRTTNKPTAEQLSQLEQAYGRFFPGNPYSYFFIDSFYNDQYSEEQRFGSVFGLFALLSLFITSLGLLSLAAFMGEQRRKEMGIRKVFGATSNDLLKMQLKDYLIIVAAATVLSLPAIYWAANRWLEGFPIRIDVAWWIYAIPPIVVALFACQVVYSQAIKAARRSPVESLYRE